MANCKIKKKNITQLLNQWQKEFAIFLPARDGGATKMARWDARDTDFLSWYRNTVLPAKASLFPVVEELFRFHKNKIGYQVEAVATDPQKLLIFGIRPCDARALVMLDNVFKDGYEDPYYLSRRRNTLLIGLVCNRSYDTCFCTSLGGGPADSSSVDLMLTDIGDELLIEAVSEAGKELLAKTSGLEAATEADNARAGEVKEASEQRVTRKVDTADITSKLLSSFENEDYWEKVAAKCVSCGICTFLCPTCYCFDITDEQSNRQGARLRCWDSCAFALYTKMPMENPRSEKWRRVRQKVCHKYGFYPMNFDVIACTGCGRCLRNCPVNWDITQVVASLPAQSQQRG